MREEYGNLERAYERMRFGWQETFAGEWQKGECMGKREDRRYGGRLAVLTFVLLCLQGTGGQAYAQEDKAGERRIRYSSSYLKEVEIPEAPEEYLEEGEITYRLGGDRDRGGAGARQTREVSGEMVYPSVTREQEIPARAPMEGGGSGEPEDRIGYAGSEKNLL